MVSIGADGSPVHSQGGIVSEQRWHAVQHTLGTDFSKQEYGGTVLSTDNSGNVYKGAFDPNCAGTDEKWKIHHMSNLIHQRTSTGLDSQHTETMSFHQLSTLPL